MLTLPGTLRRELPFALSHARHASRATTDATLSGEDAMVCHSAARCGCACRRWDQRGSRQRSRHQRARHPRLVAAARDEGWEPVRGARDVHGGCSGRARGQCPAEQPVHRPWPRCVACRLRRQQSGVEGAATAPALGKASERHRSLCSNGRTHARTPSACRATLWLRGRAALCQRPWQGPGHSNPSPGPDPSPDPSQATRPPLAGLSTTRRRGSSTRRRR